LVTSIHDDSDTSAMRAGCI